LDLRKLVLYVASYFEIHDSKFYIHQALNSLLESAWVVGLLRRKGGVNSLSRTPLLFS
jgi:hypothetical protein